MLEWLSANWGNILVITLIGIAVFFAVRSMIKDRKAGKCSCGGSCGSCGGGCSGCPMADKCHSSK